MKYNILSAAEPQSSQNLLIRINFDYLHMFYEVNIARETIARRGCVFNFLLLMTCRFFFVGLSRMLKERFLDDLYDSSEAGGKSMSK